MDVFLTDQGQWRTTDNFEDRFLVFSGTVQR